MKYKDLPPDIKAVAYQRAKEQNHKPTEDSDLQVSKNTFNWNKTIEKHDIWADVNNGDFDSFYKFHNIIPLYNENNLPKKYEVVEVSQDNIRWQKRLFLTYNKYSNDMPFIVHTKETGGISAWKYCRSVTLLTMTKEEAEKELSKIKNQTVVITVK